MDRRVPSSGRCRGCGQRIIWALKEGGNGWHRPLEEAPTGGLMAIQNGVVRPVEATLFRVHVCDPANIEKAEAERAEFIRTHVPGSKHLRVHVTKACPRCGAGVDELCRPLNPAQYAQSVYGDKGHLQNAHTERVAITESP